MNASCTIGLKDFMKRTNSNLPNGASVSTFLVANRQGRRGNLILCLDVFKILYTWDLAWWRYSRDECKLTCIEVEFVIVFNCEIFGVNRIGQNDADVLLNCPRHVEGKFVDQAIKLSIRL